MDFEQRWSLSGFKAVVTGGTQGIGKAIAEELMHFGAEVLIVARRQTLIDECLSSWRAAGFQAHGIAADMSTAEGRMTVCDKVKGLWNGTLDILVNNAGTNIRKLTVSYEEEEIQQIFETNL